MASNIKLSDGGTGELQTVTLPVYSAGTSTGTYRMMPSANIDYEAQNAKARAINEAVGNIRRTYDIKHKRVDRLRCVSAAFKEARHIELNQDCQKVIDGINHMSGLDKQDGAAGPATFDTDRWSRDIIRQMTYNQAKQSSY